MDLNPAITDEIRSQRRFSSYTEDSIKGVLIIQSMTDEELRLLAKGYVEHGYPDYDEPFFRQVSDAISPNTNLIWVVGSAFEELQLRGTITPLEQFHMDQI